MNIERQKRYRVRLNDDPLKGAEYLMKRIPWRIDKEATWLHHGTDYGEPFPVTTQVDTQAREPFVMAHHEIRREEMSYAQKQATTFIPVTGLSQM